MDKETYRKYTNFKNRKNLNLEEIQSFLKLLIEDGRLNHYKDLHPYILEIKNILEYLSTLDKDVSVGYKIRYDYCSYLSTKYEALLEVVK